ncbi:phage holin family protein [Deinococcus metallilatus]|uniref:Phage holin family protein n=1 Tax=Deinococcus metallilatus TaxID=1211322 RepID=A0AAJ5JYL9_9DEIO|nr:phage holin family protein [Deinococcus metallilatus]MBB5294854.1 hypothetical protein [Deinococcus metallilatus]QBY09429.1 phage holin family protein [Deinococcus metallilatus]RXJ09434.1 phage holin family protein [Deinococcus metallilatus]TLK28957.1 phage holin family protein [Deinococcus metallilatus]GMA16781.1 hypothetical protein GCM10025871_31120 [Deinococcus metallilatus]
MQEEHKSLGGALVDVFDAGVTLVKSEIRALLRQVTNVIKAKGIGVVLLLASVGPLLMALVFLILAVFYLLMRLGLGAWVAALIIALLGFILTGVLVMMGLRRLSAEVPHDEGERRRMNPDHMTEDERLEAQYQAEQYQAEQAARARATAGTAPVTVTSGASVMAGSGAANNLRPGADYSVPAGAEDRVEGTVTLPMPRSAEGRTETLPVYGTNPDNSQPAHGGSVDDFSVLGDTGAAGDHGPQRGHKKHDPNIQHPVVLKDEPGIDVSTTPTFREDMKKEGY